MPIRVAIVEDNKELREGLEQLISGTRGLECVGAYGACSLLLEEVPSLSPDVILMDIGLPGMSGVECVKLVKGREPDINILMLTVYDDDQKIFESIYNGASGYLLKKTPPAKILEAIEEIHAGGAPMSGKIARRVLTMFQRSNKPVSHQLELSQREKEILHGLVDGLSYKMIAEKYFVSIDTVRTHIKHIYDKLHVHSKSQAVAKAIREKLV
jgi:DNA-binding NarL/FixJ family response regulator